MYNKIKFISVLALLHFIVVLINGQCEKNNDCGIKSFNSIYTSYALNKYKTTNNNNIENVKTKNKCKNKEELTVGIIGAGVSGLYAAMILQDLGINYTIIEANKERIGGRLYTHRFDNEKYSYVDMGAMRVPTTPMMDRIISNKSYSLFSKLEKGGYKVPLVPFILSSGNTVTYINGIHTYPNIFINYSTDPYNFSNSKNGGEGNGVPDEFTNKNPALLIKGFFEGFIKNLTIDFDKGFLNLLKIDDYTVRDYLKDVAHYPNSAIEYLETVSGNTGFFDMSLSELLMTFFDFTGKEWYCIEGGFDFIPNSMSKLLKNKIEMGRLVTKITRSMDKNGDINGLDVLISKENEVGEFDSYKFKHVISTTTLSALQRIDLNDLQLPLKLKVAIRSLAYSSAIKLALNFKYRWWEDTEFMNGKPIKGGSSKTDLPIRSIIYPSYGINNGDKNQSGVLVVSYVGGRDSLRLGSLIGNRKKEDKLIQLCLNNLAEIHRVDVKKLRELYKGGKFQSWINDEYSTGAYALFQPSQFIELFPSLTKANTDGRFHLSGEATSVHHGWIIGSLNSAYRSVNSILKQENLIDLQVKLLENWGEIEQVENPSQDWFKFDHEYQYNNLLYNNNNSTQTTRGGKKNNEIFDIKH